jgi:hypothetical protein
MSSPSGSCPNIILILSHSVHSGGSQHVVAKSPFAIVHLARTKSTDLQLSPDEGARITHPLQCADNALVISINGQKDVIQGGRIEEVIFSMRPVCDQCDA